VGKISVALIVLLIAVLMVPLFQYSTAPVVFPPEQRIPFVGMSLLYYTVEAGDSVIRHVCVFGYNETTNCVIVRDSTDWWDTMEVDVNTREIKWCTGKAWIPAQPLTFYVEYWIPTNINIGSHVPIHYWHAVVIGSTKLSVCGKTVDVWQLQASGVTWWQKEDEYFQYTWYYEKKTGLLVSGAFVMFEGYGEIVNPGFAGHLVSTNVAL